MKKVLCMMMLGVSIPLCATEFQKYESCFDGAFTAGYVWKHESSFKNVYGSGIINTITGDLCYYPWERWGIGGKLSYWRRKGRTTFLKFRSTIQQLPFIVYLRRRKELDCGLQLYGSLGVGGVWTKEKSYIATIKFTKAVGEIETGMRYPIWQGVGLTAAVRYLFPPQRHDGQRVTVGGLDLRAGIGFSF